MQHCVVWNWNIPDLLRAGVMRGVAFGFEKNLFGIFRIDYVHIARELISSIYTLFDRSLI